MELQTLWVTLANLALAAVTVVCVLVVAWAVVRDLVAHAHGEPDGGLRQGQHLGRLLHFPTLHQQVRATLARGVVARRRSAGSE
jgi:hypothetical protein